MTKPLLSTRTIASLRTTLRRGLTNSGVGGETWTVSRASGDGITGPVTSGSAGIVTGHAYQEAPDRMQALLAQTRAPVQPWRFVLVSGTLQAGDAITSTTDSSIRFTVQQPQLDMLYPTAIVEPLGPAQVSGGTSPMLDFSLAGNSQYLGAI